MLVVKEDWKTSFVFVIVFESGDRESMNDKSVNIVFHYVSLDCPCVFFNTEIQ